MPTIKPISELQRNYADIVREAMQTKEPIYLTRNGESSVVVLDARTYDHLMRHYQEIHEKYVSATVELGRLQSRLGMTHTLDETTQHLREKWGDDVF